MPWCDACSKYYAPNGLQPDGTCPACGRLVAAPPSVGEGGARARVGGRPGEVDVDGDVEVKAPWHFKLLVVSAAAYQLWRAWQGVAWVIGRV
jgi:hypothetical protein